MSAGYRVTEDEYHVLQRAQLTIKTLMVLLEEHQRASTLTPQMLSAPLEATEEDMAAVLLAVGKTFSAR